MATAHASDIDEDWGLEDEVAAAKSSSHVAKGTANPRKRRRLKQAAATAASDDDVAAATDEAAGHATALDDSSPIFGGVRNRKRPRMDAAAASTGVYVIAFSLDGSTFTVTPVAKVKRAAKLVLRSVGSAGDGSKTELAMRMRNVLRVGNGEDSMVYLHPTFVPSGDSDDDDDGRGMVRYMVMNANKAPPKDAAQAHRVWTMNELHDEGSDEESEAVMDKPRGPAFKRPHEIGTKKLKNRAVYLVEFARDGHVFNVKWMPSLVAATRIVYVAAGSSHYGDSVAHYRHVYKHLKRTAVYLHPAPAGAAVSRFMIMFDTTTPPRDAAQAKRMWRKNKEQVDPVVLKKKPKPVAFGDGRGRPGRAARVIAFTHSGSVFTVNSFKSLLDAARHLHAAAHVVRYKNPRTLYSNMYVKFHPKKGAPEAVYRLAEEDSDAVVHYMVMYDSATVPRNATEATELWETPPPSRKGYDDSDSDE